MTILNKNNFIQTLNNQRCIQKLRIIVGIQYILSNTHYSASMRQEIGQKIETFTNQIRKRQRGEIMKGHRQSIRKLYAKMPQPLMHPEVKKQQGDVTGIVSQQLLQSSVKGLYSTYVSNPNLIKQLPDTMIPDVMKLLTTKQSLDSMEGIRLLGLFIQFCGNDDNSLQKKTKYIQTSLEQIKIHQTLYKLVKQSILNKNDTKAKLLLHCLKVMALIRMQRIRDKQLLSQYLPIIVQNYLQQSSTMLLLSYVSQVHPFSTHIMRMICDQARQLHSKKIISIVTCSIIENYICLQKNRQVIANMLQLFMKTLIKLYMECKSYGSRYAQGAITPILKIVQKYPQQRGKELIQKIQNVKLHLIIIVLINLGERKFKIMGCQIQQAIINNSIHDLKQQFLGLFNSEVIYSILNMLHSTDIELQQKSLKILAKLMQYATPNQVKKLQKQHDLNLVLDNLSYCKNQQIAQLAERLGQEIQNMVQDEDGQMIDC